MGHHDVNFLTELWWRVRRWLNSFFPAAARNTKDHSGPPVSSIPKVVVLRTRPAPLGAERDAVLPRRTRVAFVSVRRANIAYWEERGWKKQGDHFSGPIKTPQGSWQGRATASPSARIEMYIKDPPSALNRHAHWPCFRPQGGGWYFVHPVTSVPDVSAGILSLEKTINEAYAI